MKSFQQQKPVDNQFMLPCLAEPIGAAASTASTASTATAGSNNHR